MRGCVKQQVKQCFVGVEVKNDLGENVAEAIVNESLPLEDAMVIVMMIIMHYMQYEAVLSSYSLIL